MKLEQPINANYAAVVTTIKNIIPLEGCDNVVGTSLFGFQAIVGKDTQVGDVGIVFPAETQLSEKYCSSNNLFRHADKNFHKDKKGYIEDNRRVKAMKFRGHRSDCLFMPMDSLLAFASRKQIDELAEGDVFDFIKGEEVCRKYVVKEPTLFVGQPKKPSRVDSKFMPEHYDTENWWRNSHKVNPEAEVIVTQKLHGTSIRVANTIVNRKLSWIERIAKKLGAKVRETKFDYVYGSRKVIKDINDPNKKHYYDFDIWTMAGRTLEGLIPKNFIVYAELVGWTPGGAEIQKHYSYGLPEGSAAIFVYRVAFVNEDGIVTDLSHDQMVEFCNARAMVAVPTLWRGKSKDFKVDDFIDVRFTDNFSGAAWLGENQDIVDEGVCIRVDGNIPYILKAKSPKFLAHETAMLDEAAVDLEAEGSAE